MERRGKGREERERERGRGGGETLMHCSEFCAWGLCVLVISMTFSCFINIHNM